jgi:aryl-alcohol dehydrogenase-like predicted oxidoreductase
MRYRPLGRTGLFVSELCLGTMTFGGQGEIWSQLGDIQQSSAERLIAQAFDAGINFIDTADIYSAGLSETMVGDALRHLKIPRDRVIVATKVFGATGQGPNSRGTSRHHILEAVKASLTRLQLDHIDLYQLHGFDPATPIDETLRALDLLVRQGHIRYVGVSNWAAWQLTKALGISERLNLPRFEVLQAYYSVAGRDLERELVPMARSENVSLLVWSPLAGGLLTGKYGGTSTDPGSRRARLAFPPVDERRASACIDVMRDIGERRGVPIAAVALAWLLHQDVVTSVILGVRKLPQLSQNLCATELKLSTDELARIDSVSQLPQEYPGWMLDRHRSQRVNEA